MHTPLLRAQADIRAVLADSEIPEDPRHAEDTLAWVLRLKPDADAALAIAALAHDIDRADAATKIKREDFADYDEFKAAHARHGAELLRAILIECGVQAEIVQRACRLVELHEFGGEPDADVLKDADSLSYFRVNLPLYAAREGLDEASRRCRWGYRRLSMRARRYYHDIRHDDPQLDALLRQAAASGG